MTIPIDRCQDGPGGRRLRKPYRMQRILPACPTDQGITRLAAATVPDCHVTQLRREEYLPASIPYPAKRCRSPGQAFVQLFTTRQMFAAGLFSL